MAEIRGFSDFLKTLGERENLKQGLVVDTNILISATYDADSAHDKTIEFLDLVFDQGIPLFCNVNVRSEFLEIHRRIIFTEAILDFENAADKSKLPPELAKQLKSLRTQAEKRTKDGKAPLRLSEAEIKGLKLIMINITDNGRDLWKVVCEDRVTGKLIAVWEKAETELGLNFLSARNEDHAAYFQKTPDWQAAVGMMESQGLGSSDAMILNMFLDTTFDALVSSDRDLALAFKHLDDRAKGKLLFVPDELFKTL